MIVLVHPKYEISRFKYPGLCEWFYYGYNFTFQTRTCMKKENFAKNTFTWKNVYRQIIKSLYNQYIKIFLTNYIFIINLIKFD